MRTFDIPLEHNSIALLRWLNTFYRSDSFLCLVCIPDLTERASWEFEPCVIFLHTKARHQSLQHSSHSVFTTSGTSILEVAMTKPVS